MLQKAYNWYSKESVKKAIIEVANNREVVSVYKDVTFGKRPDMLQYPADILQAVSEGTIAFHGSIEQWSNPMKLEVGMAKEQLDNIRTGWSVFFDPDVKDFEIAKIVTKTVVEALKDYGVRNYSLKFSGGKGFHIGIPFEALPETINYQPMQKLYPDLQEKITIFIKWYMKDMLKDELIALDSPENLAGRIGKTLNEIIKDDEIDPFKIVNMDIFKSRHLFRLPYSLHESSLLVSLPMKPEDIDKFEKEQALPEKVKVEEKFLIPKAKGDAQFLVVEALDWASKHMIEERGELLKIRQFKRVKLIPEMYFPPCIKRILEGMADGKKRSLFILINFLRNMGWDAENIEKRIFEWNEKNYPPLRANYLRSQLRWHFRQADRILAPPNCENENFYKSMDVYDLCSELHTQGIKNPISYPIRKIAKVDKLKLKKK
ncbi:MAG: hypothetical protein HY361_04265 [Candidatus Aenigmarchaeota archaeon]|nr:hypothetical protein [Candidatus Aenigmarchaeota archaeon]